MKTQHVIYGLMAAAVVALTGCRNDTNGPLAESVATEDAAESVASALGQDNGGALDQLADVTELATASGISQGSADMKSAALSGVAEIDSTFDAATGTWTITLTRERGAQSGAHYAKITRVYEYRFLNKDGMPQKYWRVPNPGSGIDTAASMTFRIVSGTGEHRTPHLSQRLIAIGGNWTATGLNTDTITINGTYSRSAADTLTTRNSVRTLENALSLNFSNIKAPRGKRSEMAAKATGTITGTYDATITFTRGSLYSDKEISREISVTLAGGNATIGIGGKAFVGMLGLGMLRG